MALLANTKCAEWRSTQAATGIWNKKKHVNANDKRNKKHARAVYVILDVDLVDIDEARTIQIDQPLVVLDHKSAGNRDGDAASKRGQVVGVANGQGRPDGDAAQACTCQRETKR